MSYRTLDMHTHMRGQSLSCCRSSRPLPAFFPALFPPCPLSASSCLLSAFVLGREAAAELLPALFPALFPSIPPLSCLLSASVPRPQGRKAEKPAKPQGHRAAEPQSRKAAKEAQSPQSRAQTQGASKPLQHSGSGCGSGSGSGSGSYRREMIENSSPVS